ncbi:MAG TPA: galactose-1-phosphate uridylyltransferase [Deltaproteobacteria bacterium]|nr:MAG: galactose-1-phosphate uridylyltransferase [Deltaproteobacteria bacterium GWA2_65_63]OGP26268.1 MAG: galactose-1-phosphate uridylyltransferase [Deltaproteobacteria bacterium GWB2_65_81]OGP38439.1 MAG: galactose-1-phosphate uridylyltransferase [Deltaproteobacteria bacterium GWC2_66_88]HAM32513.1 galactose-1-phosphate uridylyltransferase [Deltaproteobacteria bacterium]HBG73535.1 galactose-1-phosphate uridylyltransferase [Deltaproteobacteria bacterium]
MTELRKDPVVGRWVIISTERAKRPHEFPPEAAPRREGVCPLCPGSERMTPPEILAFRQGGEPNDPSWTLRVVPNKFPALRIEGELGKAADGIYDRMHGIGAHEVVIESERHDIDLFDLPEKRFEDVLWAYRERLLDLKKDHRFKSVLIFKNHGAAAGASLTHSHSQLIALPVIPKRVMEEMHGCREYYRFRDRCLFCDIVVQEMDQKVRIVEETGEFLAFSPYAPRFPFETWIVPKRHQCAYEMIEGDQAKGLAAVFRRTLRRLNLALENPPFNFIVHSAPFQERAAEFYHWHIEIMPKLTKVAGFEWGSGFYINPTPPEESAKYLRELPE